MVSDPHNQDIIYRLASECEELFDQLQDTFRKRQTKTALIELCTEFQQRFAIWTSYLGVFARQSQCLDTRLQNLPDLQDLVVRFLDILHHSLYQCKIQVEDADQAQAFPEAELKAIDDTLTRLSRLGVTIRQSNRDSIDARSKRYVSDQDLGPFSRLCTEAVQALYPNANQALRNYLSNSMVDRYARILFLKSRNRTLNTRRPMPSIQEESTDKKDAEVSVNTQEEAPQVGMQMSGLPRVPIAPSQSDLSAVNTQNIRNRRRPPDEASTQHHRTLSIQVDLGSYPRPPTRNRGRVVACEWCSEPLGKVVLSEREWRRHIDRDLKPYICLSETCSNADTTYPSLNEWFDHMRLHSRQWYQKVYPTTTWVCAICDFGQSVYDSPQALYNHLEESHLDEFAVEEIQAISRQSKTERSRAWNDCLLCGFSVEEEDNRGGGLSSKRKRSAPNQESSANSRKMHRSTSPEACTPAFPRSDISSGSDSDESNSGRDKEQSIERSQVMARHIAIHLQLLMFLTLRFAALQDYDGEVDDDINSNSVDFDERSTAPKDNSVSDTDSPMEDVEDTNSDCMSIEDEITIPDAHFDFGDIPRPYDDLRTEDDDFLKGFIESRAHQPSDPIDVSYDRFLSQMKVVDPRLERKYIKWKQTGLAAESCSLIRSVGVFWQWFNQRGNEHRPLWIKGQPGAGQTQLVCYIIDQLEKMTYDPPGHMAYFFSQTANPHSSTAEAAIRHIIYQLLERKPSPKKRLCEINDDLGGKLFQDTTSWDSLFAVLWTLLEDPTLWDTYLFLDILDESPEGIGKLLELVRLLSRHGRVVVSSHGLTGIADTMNSLHCLELDVEDILQAIDICIPTMKWITLRS